MKLKKGKKKTAGEKVCHWKVQTIMIILIKARPSLKFTSGAITEGVSRPSTEVGIKLTQWYYFFLSVIPNTWIINFHFELTDSAAAITFIAAQSAFVVHWLPLCLPFEEFFQSLTRFVNNNDIKTWRAHTAPTQQVCLCKHLYNCAQISVDTDSSK